MDLFSNDNIDSELIKQFGKEWYDVLAEFITSHKFSHLLETIKKSREKDIIFPSEEDMFRAFRKTPYDKLKVIIIGQDPYHNGNADGLAFSCKKELSPSLKQIYKAMGIDLGVDTSSEPLTLDHLAEQGVFLYNPVLTVVKAIPNSHKDIGWYDLTYHVFRAIMRKKNVVWLIWGKNAHSCLASAYRTSKDIKWDKLFLLAEHPAAASHDSRTWKCDHFSRTNRILNIKGIKPINWITNADSNNSNSL